MDMKLEMAGQLWDLANIIVGFVAVQTIAFTFASAQNEFAEKLRLPWVRKVIGIAVFAFTALYVSVLYWCYSEAKSLLPEDTWISISHVWIGATVGRIVAVLLFGGLTLLVAYGVGLMLTRSPNDRGST